MDDDGSTGTWRDRAGRVILDPLDHHGKPVTTPVDRRWLWRIENTLAVAATNGTLRELARDLGEYLAETCGHHWTNYAESGWEHPDTGVVLDVIPAHRQCLWCNAVEWADGQVTS